MPAAQGKPQLPVRFGAAEKGSPRTTAVTVMVQVYSPPGIVNIARNRLVYVIDVEGRGDRARAFKLGCLISSLFI